MGKKSPSEKQLVSFFLSSQEQHFLSESLVALSGWTWLKCIFLRILNVISYCSPEPNFTHWTCLSQNLLSFLFLLLLSAQHIVSKLNTSWGKRALLRAHERWPWAGECLRFSGKFLILWRWQTARGSPWEEERSRGQGSVPRLFPARGHSAPHIQLCMDQGQERRNCLY